MHVRSSPLTPSRRCCVRQRRRAVGQLFARLSASLERASESGARSEGADAQCGPRHELLGGKPRAKYIHPRACPPRSRLLLDIRYEPNSRDKELRALSVNQLIIRLTSVRQLFLVA